MAIPLSSLMEYLQYIRSRDRWWILPILLLLAIVGFLILLATTTRVPIFIYPLI